MGKFCDLTSGDIRIDVFTLIILEGKSISKILKVVYIDIKVIKSRYRKFHFHNGIKHLL